MSKSKIITYFDDRWPSHNLFINNIDVNYKLWRILKFSRVEDKNFDLFLLGYPRSGNSFLQTFLKIYGTQNSNIFSHSHDIMRTYQLYKEGVHGLVVFRNPIKVLRSTCTYFQDFSDSHQNKFYRNYLKFHKLLIDFIKKTNTPLLDISNWFEFFSIKKNSFLLKNMRTLDSTKKNSIIQEVDLVMETENVPLHRNGSPIKSILRKRNSYFEPALSSRQQNVLYELYEELQHLAELYES